MDGGLMTNFANALPRRLYRAAQIQQLDRVVIEEFSITGFRLMQTAGAAAFNALLEQWPRAKRLLVFTGAGKNGGDGYIVAGLAKDFGMMVEIIRSERELNVPEMQNKLSNGRRNNRLL